MRGELSVEGERERSADPEQWERELSRERDREIQIWSSTAVGCYKEK